MRLIIIEGPNTGSVFWPEGDRCTIGRAHSNDVVLYDRRVSAHHAVIEPTPDGPVIDSAKCIACFCCHEMCRYEAMDLSRRMRLLQGLWQ